MGILPLICKLKKMHIDCVQPWYADDAPSLGLFQRLNLLYEDVLRLGPGYSYILNPSKCKVVVHPKHVVAAVDFFNTHEGLGFEICTGSRYLGGYVGTDLGRDEYAIKKVMGYTSIVKELATVATQKYPHTAYPGLTKSLQHK